MTSWDAIAGLYDRWTAEITQDVEFYVDQARASEGPVVELGIGTGRIGIPTAMAGVRVIGIDSSPEMLQICEERARAAGIAELIDLRVGDFRRPPVAERVSLITCPFRSLLLLETDADRREALRSVLDVLEPGGRFVFDVFVGDRHEGDEAHGEWIARGEDVFERADWDEAAGVLRVALKGLPGEAEGEIQLAALAAEEWRALLLESGFEIHACYGWFDLRPFAGTPYAIWVARRPAHPTSV